MPLTDTAVRNAKPGEKPVRLFDERGLYLEISPAGGKWWRLKYRFAGKEKRLSLGVYPAVSLKAARERRDEARRLLTEGVDPSENRKATKASSLERSGNSFEVVAREWFASYMSGKSESHRDKVIRRFERDVFPWLGGRPVAEIVPPEILATVRRIEARGALETAHRALQNVGQVCRYAVATGRAERDPTQDLRGALPPVEEGHFAAIIEPRAVGELLRAIEGFRGSLQVACALKLAPLLFVRPGELRKAEWKDIDLDAGEWRYFVTKTK
ncbi:MAG: integrase arm-type DNA-binding domain-containing protein, partial [Rhodospirillales bacterium]|nr:integrase arm-type DNA-binding domain-containing protein [Rhodospirillales bacterium]